MAISRRTSWLTRAVADEVRAMLKAKRPPITQQQVARHLGRSQAYVSERLAGQASFDLDDLDGIAELLGMHGLDLLMEAVRRGRIDEHAVDLAARRRERQKYASVEDANDYDATAAAERRPGDRPRGEPQE
jgi:transcriptional regulator with XRE-family HTH domain